MQNKKILILEDNLVDLFDLGKYLQNHGYKVFPILSDDKKAIKKSGSLILI